MSDYISREAFLAEQRHLYCENCARRKNGKGKFVYDIGDAPCRACDIGDVLDAVEDAPAADVRPVVLCRDCEYWKQWDNTTHYLCTYVAGAKFIRNAEDFCSRGEKREES